MLNQEIFLLKKPLTETEFAQPVSKDRDTLFFNYSFDKNRLKALILWSLKKTGESNTLDLVENLKNIGFEHATQAGISIGIDDLKIPPNKRKVISQAELYLESAEMQYQEGSLTAVERFQQLIDTWHRTSENLKQSVINHFRSTDVLNPVFMMAFSGARGNISQVRQLVGMRGLMSDPQGQIIDFPIRSNFREGLTLTEYVISCYGARKGVVDTALKTANSGYLTRRLVDVSQHVVIHKYNCKTTNGVFLTDIKDGIKTIVSLKDRLVGRVLAQDIRTIAFRDEHISKELASKIVTLKDKVLIRSPLTCFNLETKSVCQLCYGSSLYEGLLVLRGEAVGILAAQSIGEPGTQLTMRTFHTGGVFSGDVMDEIRAPYKGIIDFSEPLQGKLIRTSHGKVAFLTKVNGTLVIKRLNKTKPEIPQIKVPDKNGKQVTPNKNTKQADKESVKTKANKINKKKDVTVIEKNILKNVENIEIKIPPLTVLFVRQGEYVFEEQLLGESSSTSNQSNEKIKAKFNLNSELEGKIVFDDVVLLVKTRKAVEISQTAYREGTFWILAGKIYKPTFPVNLFSKIGDLVDKTAILNIVTHRFLGNGFVSRFNQSKIFVRKEYKGYHVVFDQKNLKNQKNFLGSSFKKKKKDIRKLDRRNKDFNILLNHPILRFVFKNIQFSDFGYFFSLYKTNKSDNQRLSKKKQQRDTKNFYYKIQGYQTLGKKTMYPFKGKKEVRKDQVFVKEPFSSFDQFFVKSRLKQVFKVKKDEKVRIPSRVLPFQWFLEKYKTQTGGFIKFDSVYLNKDLYQGQLLWVPEERYQICFLTSTPLKGYTKHLDLPKSINNEKLYVKKDLKKEVINKNIKGRALQKDTTNFAFQYKELNKVIFLNKISNKLPFIYRLNSQGKSIPFFSKMSGYSTILMFEDLVKGKKKTQAKPASIKTSSPLYPFPIKRNYKRFLKNPIFSTTLKPIYNKSLINQIKIMGRFFCIPSGLTEMLTQLKRPTWSAKRFLLDFQIFDLKNKNTTFYLSNQINKKKVVKNQFRKTSNYLFSITNSDFFKENCFVSLFGTPKKYAEGKTQSDIRSKESLLGDTTDTRYITDTRDTKGTRSSKKRPLILNKSNCQIQIKKGWFYFPKQKSSSFSYSSLKRYVKQSFVPTAYPFVDNLCFDQLPVFLENILNKKIDLKSVASLVKKKNSSLNIISYKAFPISSIPSSLPDKCFARPSKQGIQRIREPLEKKSMFGKERPSKKESLFVGRTTTKGRKRTKGGIPCLSSKGYPFMKSTKATKGTKALYQPRDTQFLSGKRGYSFPYPKGLTKTEFLSGRRNKRDEGPSLFSLPSLPSLPFEGIQSASHQGFLNKEKFLLKVQLGFSPIKSNNNNLYFLFRIRAMYSKDIYLNKFSLPEKIKDGKTKLKTGYSLKGYKNSFIFHKNCLMKCFNFCFLLVNNKNLIKLSAFENPVSLKKSESKKYHLYSEGITGVRKRYNPVNKKKDKMSIPSSRNQKTSKPKFSILIRKVHEYSLLSKNEYKNIFYQINTLNNISFPFPSSKTNASLTNKSYNNKPSTTIFNSQIEDKNNAVSFFGSVKNFGLDIGAFAKSSKNFNKQEPTAIFRHYPGIDLQIDKIKGFQKNKKILGSFVSLSFKQIHFVKLSVSFQVPTVFPLERVDQELLFDNKTFLDQTKMLYPLYPKNASHDVGIRSNRKIKVDPTKIPFYKAKDGKERKQGSPLFVESQSLTETGTKTEFLIMGLTPVLLQRRDTMSPQIKIPSKGYKEFLSLTGHKKKVLEKKSSTTTIKIQTKIPVLFPLLNKLSSISLCTGFNFRFVGKLNLSISPSPTNSVNKINLFLNCFKDSPKRYEGILQTLANQKFNKKLSAMDTKMSFPSPADKLKGKETITKILSDKNNWLLTNTSKALTSCFSRYTGEVVETKAESSCLLLTDLDQITYNIEGAALKGKMGHLIRCGEELSKRVGATESGQVIQVEKNKVKLRRAQPVFFSSRGVYNIRQGDFVEKGSLLLTLFYQRLKTGDIVQGIPKIEQLFEARQTKEGEIIPNNLAEQLDLFFTKGKAKFKKLKSKNQLRYSNQERAARKGLREIQEILVREIQLVYLSQGVTIADKHLEIVVRQMTSKVRIINGNRTPFVRGEIIDLNLIDAINIETVIDVPGFPIQFVRAKYEPIVLGITKAALEADSFISAASFQETTRVLSRAAIEGKIDHLRGLKERVILGELISAGTASPVLDTHRIITENLNKIIFSRPGVDYSGEKLVKDFRDREYSLKDPEVNPLEGYKKERARLEAAREEAFASFASFWFSASEHKSLQIRRKEKEDLKKKDAQASLRTQPIQKKPEDLKSKDKGHRMVAIKPKIRKKARLLPIKSESLIAKLTFLFFLENQEELNKLGC